MNKHEEIDILIKGLPFQIEYLVEKEKNLREVCIKGTGCDPDKTVRAMDLVDSARRVLYMRLERLNELVNVSTGEVKFTT